MLHRRFAFATIAGMKKLLCVILSVLFVLPPLHAFAWSEGGSKPEKAKLVSILEKNLRSAEDLAA